jgi:hypothetical protein
MVRAQQIIEQIKEDWDSKPQAKICMDILDYLLRVPIQNLLHISYGSLKTVISQRVEEADLLMAIQYLSGERTPILEVKFEFIEDDEIYCLPNSEIKLARETGQLVHPETGELIDDFEDKTYMYFEPSQLAKEIKKSDA